MQISDTIADMLTRIRNASAAKHDSVDVPASNVKKAIAQILLDEGYISGFQVEEDGKQGVIHITLKYGHNKSQVISGIRRVSKPGLRIYTNCRGYAQGYERPRHSHPFHLKGYNDRQAGTQSQCRRRSPRFRLVRRCERMSRIGRETYRNPCRC